MKDVKTKIFKYFTLLKKHLELMSSFAYRLISEHTDNIPKKYLDILEIGNE